MTQKFKCPNCGKEIEISESSEGVCLSCNIEGFWVDPAGGVHNDDGDEGYDPAAMYV
jgi:hypothetical protein